MTRYSNTYSPAAPVTLITLKNIDTLATIRNVPMLIDTGSDITLVPVAFCREIGVEITAQRSLELLSFDGATAHGTYVRLALHFAGKQFRGNFVAYDQAEGILGRNILNKFSLLLDGPNLEWDIVKA